MIDIELLNRLSIETSSNTWLEVGDWIWHEPTQEWLLIRYIFMNSPDGFSINIMKTVTKEGHDGYFETHIAEKEALCLYPKHVPVNSYMEYCGEVIIKEVDKSVQEFFDLHGRKK